MICCKMHNNGERVIPQVMSSIILILDHRGSQPFQDGSHLWDSDKVWWAQQQNSCYRRSKPALNVIMSTMSEGDA